MRTLWDGSYAENSVIGREYKQYIPLLPTVQASVNKHYSGTKIALSSYNFGGGNHISGGIAEVDALGTFAKQGVYLACLEPSSKDIPYQKAALNLFTNYDGKGAGFGNTWVETEADNNEIASAYASIDNADDRVLKIILTNKNPDSKQQIHLRINSGKNYKNGVAYGFDNKNSNIEMLHTLTNISGNSFAYTMEPMSVVELILYSDDADVTDDSDITGKISDVSDISQETTASDSQNTGITGITTVSSVMSSAQTTPVTAPEIISGKNEIPVVLKITGTIISVLTLAGLLYLFYGDIFKKAKK